MRHLGLFGGSNGGSNRLVHLRHCRTNRFDFLGVLCAREKRGQAEVFLF
jgi:hypothetical protein